MYYGGGIYYGGFIVVIAYTPPPIPVVVQKYLITQNNIDILTQDSLNITVSEP